MTHQPFDRRAADTAFAFPQSVECWGGLSNREFYAAHCPITFTEFLKGWKKTQEATMEETLQRYAEFRFEYADAMLVTGKESA
jgi:hypothetical protein